MTKRLVQPGDRICLPMYGWGVIHNLSVNDYGMVESVEIALDSGKWLRVVSMQAHAGVELKEIILH